MNPSGEYSDEILGELLRSYRKFIDPDKYKYQTPREVNVEQTIALFKSILFDEKYPDKLKENYPNDLIKYTNMSEDELYRLLENDLTSAIKRSTIQALKSDYKGLLSKIAKHDDNADVHIIVKKPK